MARGRKKKPDVVSINHELYDSSETSDVLTNNDASGSSQLESVIHHNIKIEPPEDNNESDHAEILPVLPVFNENMKAFGPPSTDHPYSQEVPQASTSGQVPENSTHENGFRKADLYFVQEHGAHSYYTIGDDVFARDVSGYYYLLDKETGQFVFFSDWEEDEGRWMGLCAPTPPTYLSFDKNGVPVFPRNEDGAPILPCNEIGERIFPTDPDSQLPIFPFDFDANEPALPVDETNGFPIFPAGAEHRPIVPLDSSGRPVFPRGQDGQFIFPMTETGQPVPPITIYGKPVVPYDDEGQPFIPVDESGAPLLYMGGDDRMTPMVYDEYCEWYNEYMRREQASSSRYDVNSNVKAKPVEKEVHSNLISSLQSAIPSLQRVKNSLVTPESRATEESRRPCVKIDYGDSLFSSMRQNNSDLAKRLTEVTHKLRETETEVIELNKKCDRYRSNIDASEQKIITLEIEKEKLVEELHVKSDQFEAEKEIVLRDAIEKEAKMSQTITDLSAKCKTNEDAQENPDSVSTCAQQSEDANIKAFGPPLADHPYIQGGPTMSSSTTGKPQTSAPCAGRFRKADLVFAQEHGGHFYFTIGDDVFAKDFSGYFYLLDKESKQFGFFAESWQEDEGRWVGVSAPAPPTYLSFDKNGVPVFPRNDDGFPILPCNELGERIFPTDPESHLPIFPYDFTTNEPTLPLDESNGYPIFPSGAQKKPMVPLDSKGKAVFPRGGDGQYIFPMSEAGQPIPPITIFGNPVVPIDDNGQPVIPHDEAGTPLLYMGGDDQMTPMLYEEYCEWYNEYLQRTQAASAYYDYSTAQKSAAEFAQSDPYSVQTRDNGLDPEEEQRIRYQAELAAWELANGDNPQSTSKQPESSAINSTHPDHSTKTTKSKKLLEMQLKDLKKKAALKEAAQISPPKVAAMTPQPVSSTTNNANESTTPTAPSVSTPVQQPPAPSPFFSSADESEIILVCGQHPAEALHLMAPRLLSGSEMNNTTSLDRSRARLNKPSPEVKKRRYIPSPARLKYVDPRKRAKHSRGRHYRSQSRSPSPRRSRRRSSRSFSRSRSRDSRDTYHNSCKYSRSQSRSVSCEHSRERLEDIEDSSSRSRTRSRSRSEESIERRSRKKENRKKRKEKKQKKDKKRHRSPSPTVSDGQAPMASTSCTVDETETVATSEKAQRLRAKAAKLLASSEKWSDVANRSTRPSVFDSNDEYLRSVALNQQILADMRKETLRQAEQKLLIDTTAAQVLAWRNDISNLVAEARELFTNYMPEP